MARWFFVTATVAPIGWLLGWIAAGESDPASIENPDLRNLYDGDLGISGRFIFRSWAVRVLIVLFLALFLSRYVRRVRDLRTTFVAGSALAASSLGFIWVISRYKEAEARLALSPYMKTLEDASWWWLPFLAVVGIICGVAPWFDAPDDSA